MAGAATLSGPLLNSTSEADVRAAPIGFNLTLINETWVEGVGKSDTPLARQLSQALLRAIRPSGRWGDEPYGWDQLVRPATLTAPTLPVYRADDTTIVSEVR